MWFFRVRINVKRFTIFCPHVNGLIIRQRTLRLLYHVPATCCAWLVPSHITKVNRCCFCHVCPPPPPLLPNQRYMHRDSCGLWALPPTGSSTVAAAHIQASPAAPTPMDLEEEENEAPNSAGTQGRNGRGKGKGKKKAGTTTSTALSGSGSGNGSGSLSAKVEAG